MISSQIRVLLISASWVLLMLHLEMAVCNPLTANCTGNCLSSTLQPNLTSVPIHGGNHSTKAPHEDAQHKSHGGIKVAKFDFERVKTPFVVCLWILIASLAKIGFHLSSRLSTLMPESCMLIILGIPIGIILSWTSAVYFLLHLKSVLLLFATTTKDALEVLHRLTTNSNLTLQNLAAAVALFGQGLSHVFMKRSIHLTPYLRIILEAGYFMPIRAFYSNIGTILLYATVGTIFNSFAVGLSLYFSGAAVSIQYSLMQALLFGSLISAVDPVAVLAVFEEVQVNEILYILVFGESVLNDAASVVLYHTFEAMSKMSVITAEQVILAITSFFVVSLGGLGIGILWGLATSFVTRFTKHVLVIEPIFIFIMSYMAYLTAEIFHFSGIMAILFCGMTMEPYVESNISRKSHTTIKYFMKLLSSCCETIIFMFLGVSLVMDKHRWNTSFVFLTLLFITIYRAIGVLSLTAIANRCGRLTKIGATDQFIMSYGGLRGAVAFCLAILLDRRHLPSELREMLITTTMVVVIFTVFVQGTTIGPLVKFLKIKRKEKEELTMTGVINDRILDHLLAGVEEISGHRGHSYWQAMSEYFSKMYLRKYLLRDPEEGLDEEIILANRRMAYKKAMKLAENPSALLGKGDGLSPGKSRNPSYAFALALRENADLDENQPHLDTGVYSACAAVDQEEVIKHNISFVMPRPRAPKLSLRARSATTHKYSLASLDEPDQEEEIPCRYNKYKRNALAHMLPSNVASQHNDQSKERKHHHHRRNKRKEPGLLELAHIRTKTIEEADDDDSQGQLHADASIDGGISFQADKCADEAEVCPESESLSKDHSYHPTVGPVPYQTEPVRDLHFDQTIPEDVENITSSETPKSLEEPGVVVHASAPQRMRSLERQDHVPTE